MKSLLASCTSVFQQNKDVKEILCLIYLLIYLKERYNSQKTIKVHVSYTSLSDKVNFTTLLKHKRKIKRITMKKQKEYNMFFPTSNMLYVKVTKWSSQ